MPLNFKVLILLMKRQRTIHRALLASSLLAGSLLDSRAGSYEVSSIRPPELMRELRGAWVASIGNIDWPSTNGLTTAQQKSELLAILDRAVQLRLNTIILQVR